MKKQPRPHQRRALRDIVPSITQKKHKRVTTIMPCGTGKTMVQLWTAEALKPKTILVLLPSLALLRQTLHEWMAETKWKKPEVLCVCSDETVGTKKRHLLEDDVMVTAEDIGYPVTSDSDEIDAYLSKKSSGVKLVFSTYHSAPLVADGMRKGFAFDVAVFDEAHVTAGEEGRLFNFALKDENLPISVRTFWTATPRHYDLDETGRVGTKLAYSMDDESVYGPIVHKLTFKSAVTQGIICDYQIVVSTITNKMLGVEEIETGEVIVDGQRVPAKIVAHHMALDQAIKAHDVRKIFTFHARVADAREFTNGGPQSVARQLPRRFQTFHVNGKMTTAERDVLLEQFRQSRHALMSNARCLTQGIDVPDVDMVGFLCKKRGLIDIVQATGRAMRKAPGKTKGYILVPLYVNLAAGETVDEASMRSEYRELVAVLNALRDQDDALADEVSELRQRKPKSGESFSFEKMTVVGPCINIEKLRAAITTICVDRLARTREIYATWEKASEAAIKLGIKNPVEYARRYKEDLHLPCSSTIQTYKDFPGWTAFLGRVPKKIYQKWQQASKAAIRLGFSWQPEYSAGYKQDPRLPARPTQVYKDFPGWDVFLGRAEVAKEFYPSWQEAGQAAQNLGLSSAKSYAAGYKKDPRLHSDPSNRYEDFPGWDVFLKGKKRSFYETCAEASDAAQKLGITSSMEYLGGAYREDPLLPGTPNKVYSDWPGWPQFLRKKSLYPDWQQAAAAAKKVGISSSSQYRGGYKKDPRLPSVPSSTYEDFPGWDEFFHRS